MSREIKFRAWDVENKEMIPADALAFEEYLPLCELLRDSDHMKYMQYTGLHDKSGKEIYEGDIIKEIFRDRIGVVKSGTYQSCFDSQKTAHQGFYVEWGENNYYRKDLGYWATMVETEVIGNIYENPKLLESEGTK